MSHSLWDERIPGSYAYEHMCEKKRLNFKLQRSERKKTFEVSVQLQNKFQFK